MPPLDERLIDDYLQDLCRELEASPEQQREIARELRAHLLDAARDGTVQAALDDFGPAEHIGQQLRQVHGRATWVETGLAAAPLILLVSASALAAIPWWAGLSVVALALGCAAGRSLLKHTEWPLWAWSWIGCIPLLIPNAPAHPLWGALAYLVILLALQYRNWLDVTLALYPLSTLWAFERTVLPSQEVMAVGWGQTTLLILGASMAAMWSLLLARTLRTPSGRPRIARALQSQGIVFILHALIIVAARLWPTYPFPYAFTPQYFLLFTVPYGILHGLPYLLFAFLTSLPALSALIHTFRRQQPPSRPILSG